MNWFGFTFTMGIITLVLIAVAISIFDSSDKKEVPCYDYHNNIINGVTCKNVNGLSQSDKLLGGMLTFFGWILILIANILVWREQ